MPLALIHMENLLGHNIYSDGAECRSLEAGIQQAIEKFAWLTLRADSPPP